MLNTDFFTKPFPVLDMDDNYYLREHQLTDTTAFFAYYSDPQVNKHILATHPTTPSEANDELIYCRNLYYNCRGIYWSIARKDNDKMIGAIGVYINTAQHRAEICYDLAKKYWGAGITSQALRIVIEFLFRKLELQRIEALTTQANIGSIKVLEKLGFTHEGTLHNYRYFKDKIHDVEMFSVLPSTFKLATENFKTSSNVTQHSTACCGHSHHNH